MRHLDGNRDRCRRGAGPCRQPAADLGQPGAAMTYRARWRWRFDARAVWMQRPTAQDPLTPRVRGSLIDPCGIEGLLGSIPARAGEPARPGARDGSAGVYPRACGGTAGLSQGRRFMRGLSPRVRGNPSYAHLNASALGSIPARAGEPRDAGGVEDVHGVYPRACGGTKVATREVGVSEGLSPRVRGNPGGAARPGDREGSIPARAGEPAHGAG